MRGPCAAAIRVGEGQLLGQRARNELPVSIWRDPAFRLSRNFSKAAVSRVPEPTAFVRGSSRTPARGRSEMPVRRAVLLPLLVSGALFAMLLEPSRCQEPETPDWRMTLKTIRNGVHKIDTYLNAALDLLGGEDGLCQYKCSDGNNNNTILEEMNVCDYLL